MLRGGTHSPTGHLPPRAHHDMIPFMSTYTMRQKPQFLKAGEQQLVVLDARDWAGLVSRLEDKEDGDELRAAVSELNAAGGDPDKAGWLRWDELGKQADA